MAAMLYLPIITRQTTAARDEVHAAMKVGRPLVKDEDGEWFAEHFEYRDRQQWGTVTLRLTIPIGGIPSANYQRLCNREGVTVL